MADINEKGASGSTKLVGSDSSGNETNYIDVTNEGAVKVTSSPSSALEVTLNLTTTVIEAKVGGSALVGRQYVELEAVDKNIMWGYSSACLFSIGKGQFISIDADFSLTVYVKMDSGTGSLIVAEK